MSHAATCVHTEYTATIIVNLIQITMHADSIKMYLYSNLLYVYFLFICYMLFIIFCLTYYLTYLYVCEGACHAQCYFILHYLYVK